MSPNPLDCRGTDLGLGLTRDEVRLYEAVLRLGEATASDLAESLDTAPENLEGWLARLNVVGLVERRGGGRVVATHPASAISELITERLSEISLERQAADRLFGAATELTRQYESRLTYESAQLPVEPIQDMDHEFADIVLRAFDGTPVESMATVPDQRIVVEYLRASLDAWTPAIREGVVDARLLFGSEALQAPESGDVTDRLVAAGARVRMLRELPSWFYVLGRDAVGLPLVWGESLPEHGYNHILVRAPSVAAAARALFEELWQRATPLRAPGDDHDQRRPVLRLAAQGLSDDRISRQLGLSVRTVRARIADAMTELGARSRFQAGVRAAHRGWL